MKHGLLSGVLFVALGVGVSSGAATEHPPIHCGVDSFWGPGTCRGNPGEIYGTEGRDRIVGSPKDDVIVALGGNDRIRGRGGQDVICGDAGDDFISGGKGEDGQPSNISWARRRLPPRRAG